ncbi:MAG TPA: penicillin-binding transpeptidase domain-containing protein [Anaeromyxobacteraceae bacterium]|nr:penicillin-binding transpeptidase domain-containing protein [Anaeromyxobacteraceae bacterium]
MTIVRPLTAAALAAALALGAAARAQAPAAPATASAIPILPLGHALPPEPLLSKMRLDRSLGRFVAPYGSGKAILTIDPAVQGRLEQTLASFAVPWGATVLLDPATGRVIAMAEHAESDPGLLGGVFRARAPAASIFKIVTAAALLERGLDPREPVCFHGGQHRLSPGLLQDDPRRDHRCLDLEAAFGHSANVVFAKLAGRLLSPAELRAQAERFFFNASIPFEGAVEPSRAALPEDRFGMANAAAGFGEVRMSPLHGALLAAVVANGGVLSPPRLVEAVEGGPTPAAHAPARIVDEGIAARLGEMMRATVTEGTGRRVFRRPPPSLRGVAVAGKTGSLFDRNPFRDWSWFVGYAPAEHPQVVVATVIMNGPKWRVRAPWVAREALAAWFEGRVAAATPVALPGGALAAR